MPAGTLTYSIPNIGEGLKYTFGIRACNEDDVCDTNAIVKSATTVDTAAPPTTTGAASLAIENGKAAITAPWTPASGAIMARTIYVSTDGGSTYPATFPTPVTNPENGGVPEVIYTGTLVEGTTYHFIVKDTDALGNENNNSNTVTVTTGDLTAPTFSGILTVAASGGDSETEINYNFTALDPAGAGFANDVSHYQLYRIDAATEGDLTDPLAAADACTDGTLIEEFAANLYTANQSVTRQATGLSPRTQYRLCLKARDSSGNISYNPADKGKARYTLDSTPPDFLGLTDISFNGLSNETEFEWIESTSADIDNYKIKLWKKLPDDSLTSPTTFSVATAAYANPYGIATASFAVNDGDTVYAVMYACDNTDAIPESGTTQTVRQSLQMMQQSHLLNSIQPLRQVLVV